jgi:hypothetical protein
MLPYDMLVITVSHKIHLLRRVVVTVTLHNAMLSYVTLCCVMFCFVVLRYVTLCCVVVFYVTLCYVTLRCAVLCHAYSCCVMLLSCRIRYTSRALCP